MVTKPPNLAYPVLYPCFLLLLEVAGCKPSVDSTLSDGLQAFPHRGLAASNVATIESASNVTAAITTNVTTGSTDHVTIVDPNAVAMATNASVAELVAPNTTINGLVTAALLDDAAYVAAPVPVVSSTILNISANNASASVLVSLTAIHTTLGIALTNQILATSMMDS